MLMYAAAVATNNYLEGQRHYSQLTELEQKYVMSVDHMLESFHYIGKNKIPQQLREINRRIFLDSGAFSAFTLNKEITVEEYCEFINLNRDIILVDDGVEMIAGLDGIGDALLTYNNLKLMESYGCKAIPCFHAGEDERYLEYYIQNYPYIALGGMVGQGVSQLKMWLDRVWEKYLIDGSGNAKIKVHGFGITSFDLMWMYPWHCMTKENHEVLTKNGWKYYDNLSIGDEILCFDKGISYWDVIKSIPEYQVTNIDINIIENRNFKCYVTDNHRWVTNKRNTKNYVFKNTNSMYLSATDTVIPRVGDYIFPTIEKYGSNFCELVGWIWTDGTITNRDINRRYCDKSIVIYQSESANFEKVTQIRELLIALNEPYCESTTIRDDGRIEKAFEFYGENCRKFIELFPDKHINCKWVSELTKQELEGFIKTSVLGDGTFGRLKRTDSKNSFVLTQKLENSIDAFQMACLLLSIPANKTSKDGYYAVQSSSVKDIYCHELYGKKEKYSGKIWCVEVNSGAFFTRCDGKIYVTGNSVDSSTWIQAASFGMIMTAEYGNISVSTKSPSRHLKNQHYCNVSKDEQEYLLKNLICRKGFEYDRLSTSYQSRVAYNIEAYRDINRAIIQKRNQLENHHIQQDLF